MKSKFSYKSKRTIIIAAIITVLLAGTATGVYFFTKGNAQAQAAGDNNTTQEQYGEAPEENKNEQQNNTTENEQNKNEQGETTPNQQEEQETERQEQTTNNNQTTQNEQTTTTTTGEVPNQEYVTEREETVKNPWESLEVGWGPTQFASIASTANLTAKKSNLEIHKTVDKESVKIGDTLTYTISVKNNGDKVAKAIIYDNVPEGTVLLNKDNNEDENTKKLTWRVTVEPGETENVEFTVRVKAEKGTIKNSAIVNGKTTEETETGIINITGKKEVDKAEAKVGDTLTYTITLTNSGNATGTVTVTDEIPTGTRIKDENTTGYNKATNTMTWSNVEVKANGGTATLTLEVVVKDDTTDTVKNVAKIDNKEIPEKPETKVANITGVKSVDKSNAKVGDTLHYTIKVTETRGLVDASGINVTDPIPEGLENVRNITHNGNLNEGNVEWNNLTITKNSSITLEFDATVSATTIGKTISNTANLGGTTSGDSNTVTTTVSELKAAVKEIKKGTTGKDAVNVVLVMDLSYSMQEKKTTDNVTRLEAAKKAATKFINSIYTKDPNSKVTVTVLTFNTKNPVTGIVGKTECTAWHNHDRHGCKKINGVWYSDWEETTETLPYSGTLKLGFADKTNYSSLVSKIEEITLPDSNPSYNYGWNTTGLGTNVYEALQLTESTVKELETNHSENSNVVILLSDGAPTTSYSGNSSWNEYEELRNKASEIKGNPITTEFYSIQFGTEDGAYGLLQAMSSNNSVYTSNSIDTLVENFTNILEQNITKDPIDTVNGKYTTTLSNPLVVDADNPITVTYEGTTLFTCTSLPSNGLTYDSTTKTISWDINAWNAVEGHPKVTTNNIVIQCYVER